MYIGTVGNVTVSDVIKNNVLNHWNRKMQQIKEKQEKMDSECIMKTANQKKGIVKELSLNTENK